MANRFVRPAQGRRVHGELCFHAPTGLDASAATALMADLTDYMETFGWDASGLHVVIKHEDAADVAVSMR